MTKTQQAEFDALSADEKSLYFEAIACGACHDDAMDAASTF